MTPRSPAVVLLLSIVTLGIYALVWHVQTKNELNRVYQTRIPTAWWLLVPFIGPLYWLWKWSDAAETATGTSGIAIFLLMVLYPLPVIGIPVMVSKFNKATPVRVAPFAIAA